MSWCGRLFCWPAPHHWIFSWSTPPSVGQWTPWSLLPCGHTWEGSERLQKVEWWSRGAPREAGSLGWCLLTAHPQMWTLWHLSGSCCFGSPEEVDFHLDCQGLSQLGSLQIWRFLFLWFHERSDEEVPWTCTLSLSTYWALGRWMDTRNECPGWLCFQPSPEQTSMLRQFSQCQQFPLSSLFWSAYRTLFLQDSNKYNSLHYLVQKLLWSVLYRALEQLITEK